MAAGFWFSVKSLPGTSPHNLNNLYSTLSHEQTGKPLNEFPMAKKRLGGGVFERVVPYDMSSCSLN